MKVFYCYYDGNCYLTKDIDDLVAFVLKEYKLDKEDLCDGDFDEREIEEAMEAPIEDWTFGDEIRMKELDGPINLPCQIEYKER